MAFAEKSRLTPAEKYEEFFVPGIFGPWARLLVELAAPRPGQSVLDLACGTGVVARLAAPLAGASGKVVALDLRPGMLAAARSLPAPAGASIEWVEGDATDPGFPDASFDHIICQAGLMFFPDRERALREARRMLKPGGKLTLLVWQSLDKQPLFHALAESEFRHLAPLGVTEEEFNIPFSMGNAAELKALLDRAGFKDIEIRQDSRDARFAEPENFIYNVEFAYSAVIPEFAADPDLFSRFVDAVTEETRKVVASYREGDEIVFPLHANIATARR